MGHRVTTHGDHEKAADPTRPLHGREVTEHAYTTWQRHRLTLESPGLDVGMDVVIYFPPTVESGSVRHADRWTPGHLLKIGNGGSATAAAVATVGGKHQP